MVISSFFARSFILNPESGGIQESSNLHPTQGRLGRLLKPKGEKV
jgi:hypothetical protein